MYEKAMYGVLPVEIDGDVALWTDLAHVRMCKGIVSKNVNFLLYTERERERERI